MKRCGPRGLPIVNVFWATKHTGLEAKKVEHVSIRLDVGLAGSYRAVLWIPRTRRGRCFHHRSRDRIRARQARTGCCDRWLIAQLSALHLLCSRQRLS
jgi:hypothetical protein